MLPPVLKNDSTACLFARRPIRQSTLTRYCPQDTSRASDAERVQQLYAHCNALAMSAATNADAPPVCVRGIEQLFASGALC